MHFIDAWTTLSPFQLLRLLLPAALLSFAVFVPGRLTSRIAALGVALSVPFLPELNAPAPVVAGWTALWLLIAWTAGRPALERGRPTPAAFAGVESGTVGLLVGLALIALLIAAVARQDQPAEDGRRASFGLVLLGVGLLHLMLRRHVRRAVVAFGAMGLGLQVLDGVARAAQVGARSSPGAVVISTALAIAMVSRLARNRERVVGSAWVSDAHDLHD